MEGLKAVAEVIDHVLYELLGLFLPGAAFVLLLAYVAGGETWTEALRLSAAHPWIAFGGAYLLGYAVQGISRPVVDAVGWVLGRPGWFLTWIRRKAGGGPEAPRPLSEGADLDRVAEAVWRRRLGLVAEERLSTQQVRDLSFSVLGSARHRLDRYRAATSLCRGVATAVVVALALLLAQVAWGIRPVAWKTAGAAAGLLLAFVALRERSLMYDRLWGAIITPQFLASTLPGESGEGARR